jgi:hypothetical protein
VRLDVILMIKPLPSTSLSSSRRGRSLHFTFSTRVLEALSCQSARTCFGKGKTFQLSISCLAGLRLDPRVALVPILPILRWRPSVVRTPNTCPPALAKRLLRTSSRPMGTLADHCNEQTPTLLIRPSSPSRIACPKLKLRWLRVSSDRSLHNHPL